MMCQAPREIARLSAGMIEPADPTSDHHEWCKELSDMLHIVGQAGHVRVFVAAEPGWRVGGGILRHVFWPGGGRGRHKDLMVHPRLGCLLGKGTSVGQGHAGPDKPVRV